MLKNMTRKGLALGTGLALVATGFVAAPAQATATGLLWSAYGQSNEMVGVAGHVFTLRMATPTNVSDTGTDAKANIASQVSVKMVANANVANITPTVTGVEALDAASGSGTITAQVATDYISGGDDDGADDASELYQATGLIEVAPPTVLTHSIQVEVQVTYDDGSKSEVETITFLPSKSVSAAITVSPVLTAATSGAGSFSFAGINTGNFISSNFTVQDGAQAAGATKIDINVLQGTTARVATVGTYDAVNDLQPFTYSATIAAADVITVGLSINDVEINKYFDSTLTAADAAEGKFTVAAAASYDSLDIAVATSASVAHNKSATATSLISTAETVVALEGTKSLNFTITAYTDGATRSVAASSGIPITVTLRDDVAPVNDLGTTTITAGGKSLDITGTSTSFTLTTNSSGQVAFTVTANNAKDGESFKIDAVGSLAAISLDQTTVRWEEAAWKLIPALADDFVMAPKSSLAVDYTVVDQFGNLANADYQVAFTRAAGSGDRDTAAEYANWSYVAPVSAAGKASVTIVDNGADVEGKDTVTATLQKKATAGGAFISTDPAATDSFVITYEKDLAALTSTAKVNYNGITNAAGTAIAPVFLESDPLVNFDQRVSNLRTGINKWDANNVEADGVLEANYVTDELLRVFGTVVTTNNAPVAGVAVKLSATGLNFADKKALADITRASNDSIVVFTDATGSYEAFVRSSVAGKQTIAVDAQGAKSSVDVRFQESTGVATTLTLTVPASVNPGARADFVAKVVDKFGKPVSGVTVNFKDNGPGVLSATSAATDPFGDASVTLTTLTAESGTTTVTAWATIGGETVSVTKTITVGSAAGVTGKVNVGSFNGKLVVYASGLQGSTISWKVGGNWGKGVASSNYSIFNRPTPRAGVTVSVDIYVNGVKTLTKSVVTR